MSDPDKRTFDAYTKLAEYWADSYERRRQVEWKMSLGFWAVILSGIVSNDKLHGVWSCWFAWLSLLVWLVYIFLWLVPVMQKNERDKRLSYYYVSLATTSLLRSAPPDSAKQSKTDEKELDVEVNVTNPGTKPRWSWLRIYSPLFHTITTALLLIALNYSLYLHRF